MVVERDEKGRVVGGALNPGGRPKDIGEFRALCRKRTRKALRALEAALIDPKSCVAAARALLEFGWGKPVQQVSLGNADGEPLRLLIEETMSKLSPDEAAEFVRATLKEDT